MASMSMAGHRVQEAVVRRFAAASVPVPRPYARAPPAPAPVGYRDVKVLPPFGPLKVHHLAIIVVGLVWVPDKHAFRFHDSRSQWLHFHP